MLDEDSLKKLVHAEEAKQPMATENGHPRTGNVKSGWPNPTGGGGGGLGCCLE